jgi:hypothetical protein
MFYEFENRFWETFWGVGSNREFSFVFEPISFELMLTFEKLKFFGYCWTWLTSKMGFSDASEGHSKTVFYWFLVYLLLI